MKKHILITGATSGIGHQLVLDYLEQDQVVYAIGRRKEVLQNLEKKGAVVFEVELTNREQTIEILRKIHKIDLVISCAGVCHYIDLDSTPKNLQNNKEKEEVINFDAVKIMQVMNVNYGTLVNTIEAVLPLLKQSSGRLVAIGSASAYVPFPRAEAYGSSKAAVHYLMKTLLVSLQPHGVKVSLVVPGFIDTPMTAKNDFPMPFLQTTAQASRAIRKGIEKKKTVIQFPKHLTLPLQTLSILPDALWYKVSKSLYKN